MSIIIKEEPSDVEIIKTVDAPTRNRSNDNRNDGNYTTITIKCDPSDQDQYNHHNDRSDYQDRHQDNERSDYDRSRSNRSNNNRHLDNFGQKKKKKIDKKDKNKRAGRVTSPKKSPKKSPKRRLRRPLRPHFTGEYSDPGVPRSPDDFPGMTGRNSEENAILDVSNHSTKVDLTFEVSAVTKIVIHVKTLLKCKDGVRYLRDYMAKLKRKEFLEWAHVMSKYPFLRKICK